MSKFFNVTELGFEFREELFINFIEFQKVKSIFKSQLAVIDSDSSFLLNYEELYNYRTTSNSKSDLESLFFRYKIPKYDNLKFEVIHQGRIDTSSFRLRISIYNKKQNEIELVKENGSFYKDKFGIKYFLSIPNVNLIKALEQYQKDAKDVAFSKYLEFRLKAYSRLLEAYDKLELNGNSLLDTYKVKIVDNLQYNLTGNEDGSWDIVPAFEHDLEKFNSGLNEAVENADRYSKSVVFRDRAKKKKYNLYFLDSAEKAWREFVEIKKLAPDERSKRLKIGDFIEMFPPKLILANVYSDRVTGFTLDAHSTVARDNKASESWSDGLDEVSNLIKSTSGAVFNVSLSPSPDVYAEIKAKIIELRQTEEQQAQEAKAKSGAIMTEPVVEEETVYIEALKDEFNLTELETLATRIEKSNTVEIDDNELNAAKEMLVSAKSSNELTVLWGEDITGKPKTIPTKSLELSLKSHLEVEGTNKTVTVNIRDNDLLESSVSHNFEDKWYTKLCSIKEAETCESFKKGITLRSYQAEGYAWLQSIAQDHKIIEHCGSRGVLLADDMGLGKTIQVIRLLAHFKTKLHTSKPILVVGPVSLLKTSWENDGFNQFLNDDFLAETQILYLSEIRDRVSNKVVIQEILNFEQKLKDNPDLSFKEIEFGEEVSFYLDKFKSAIGASIVMCSYETMRSRIFELATIEFSLIILDEAQKIKNISTGQSRAAKALKGDMKVAMTGTPIENSIMDLWNICDFAVPGYIGDVKNFREKFHNRISHAPLGSEERKIIAKELEEMLKPMWLRRTKKEIFKNGEIPEAIHYDSMVGDDGRFFNKHLVQMSDEQFSVFETQVGYFNDCGRNQKLAAIRNMLEACYSPWWAKGIEADYSNIDLLFRLTPKLKVTFEILENIARNEEKVLIFVNIKELQQELAWLIQQWYFSMFRKSVDCEFFNGDLSLGERTQMLSRFKKTSGFKAIIISPRSGGAGLNLVEANHVIHYTREWNPAVERQATDRAYRLKQTKKVHVYYPTSSLSERGIVSAEEHLANILRDKREVIDDFTVSQGDLGNAESQFNTFSFSTNDTRLTVEGVKTIGPNKFEKLVGLYFRNKGYQVDQIGMAGDKGCDVVCHGRDENILVQVKFTEQRAPQGTKAILEIRGSRSFYETKYNKKFKLAAFTNSNFQPNAMDLALVGELVELYTEYELNEFIQNNEIYLSQLK